MSRNLVVHCDICRVKRPYDRYWWKHIEEEARYTTVAWSSMDVCNDCWMAIEEVIEKLRSIKSFTKSL